MCSNELGVESGGVHGGLLVSRVIMQSQEHIFLSMKATKPKKQGSPSIFQGQCAFFLEKWTDEYADASRNKSTPKLWFRIFPQYWRLPLNEEPSAPIEVDISEDWVAPVVPQEVLTTEEESDKKKVMESTQKVCSISTCLFENY
jgi:hypothetical protein